MMTLLPARSQIWILLVAQFGAGACATSDAETETICTLVGCEDGFTLELETRLRLGTYEVTFATEDGTTMCQFAVVDDMHPATPALECEGDIDAEVGEQYLAVAGTPSEVSVRLEHVESGTVVQQNYQPEYNEVRPNGPDCEPLCRVAGATFPWKGHEDPFVCAEAEVLRAIRWDTDWPEVVEAIAGETDLCTACPNAARQCIEQGQCWNAHAFYEGSTPPGSSDDLMWECYPLGYCLEAELGVTPDSQCPASQSYD